MWRNLPVCPFNTAVPADNVPDSMGRKSCALLIDENIVSVEGNGRSVRYAFVRTEEQMRVDRVKLVKEIEKKLL